MSSGIEVKKVMCFGCSLNAGVKAIVKDGRVVKLEADPEHYLGRGWLCERSKAFIQHLYHEDRLNYPMKRVGKRGGGKWERISWEQGLDEIAEKLKQIKEQFGAEALAALGGTGRGHQQIIKERFMNLFGSPNSANAGQWCALVCYQIENAVYGASSRGKGALKPSKCIVLWSQNPEESQACLYRGLLRQKREGTKFICIDPKRSESVADLADIWVPLRPGTDAALALGWLNVIIEERLYDKEFVDKWCYGFDKLEERVREYPPRKVAEITWVPEETIIESARLYATSKPASIQWGVKSDMQGVNVTSINHAKAILRAITGNLDVAGGDILMGPCEKANYGPVFEYLDMLPPEQTRKQLGADRHRFWCWPGYELVYEASKPYWYGKGNAAGYMPACHTTAVYDAIITGKPYPVKAVICGGDNPLVAYPNTKHVYEALKSPNLELFVVIEQWMTPTAMLADYVFPATNWLEMPVMHMHTLQGLGNYVYVGEKAVEPLYERKPDYYFYQGLGLRLGQEKYWRKTLEEEFTWCIEPLLKELGYSSAEEFAKKQGWWFPPLMEKRYEKINPKTGKPWGFATPTGKVELYSTILEKLGYDPLPHYEEHLETPISAPELAKEYPLILTTGSRVRGLHHSEHRQMQLTRRLCPYPTVEIHPDTAKKLGINDGDWVYIETVRGKIKQKAWVTPKIPPYMIDIQHAWWFPERDAEEPTLYGVFESNANILTPDDDRYMDSPTGAAGFLPYLCKVYPVHNDGEKVIGSRNQLTEARDG